MDSEYRSPKKARRVGGIITSFSGTCQVEISEELSQQSKKFKLFQVPKSFANEVLLGQSRIVGDETGVAAICSVSNTYSIKKVETSNSVYLVKPSLSDVFSLESLHHEYYEVAAMPPKVEKLEQWLRLSAYSGLQEESAFVKAKLVTFQGLQENIQASDKELREALKSIGTIEIDGFVRMVDRLALREVCNQLVDTIMEHRWSLQDISTEACLNELPGVDANMLKYALRHLALEGTDGTNGVWALDYRAVAMSVAQKLFRQRLADTGERIWPSDDFLVDWSVHMPAADPSSPCACPPEDCLQGIAVREEVSSDTRKGSKASDKTWRYFFLPVEDLSSNVQSRFQQLFDARSRYSLEEISPYLVGLCGPHMQYRSAAELLLAYTTVIDGYYFLKKA